VILKRHFILTPFGSAGDVHPFLWMGRLLQERGHRVTLVAASPFAEIARRVGVPFQPVGAPGIYEEVIRNPKLWHPWHGMHLTLRYAGQATGEYFDAIAATRETIGGTDTVLVGSMLAFGARLAREKFNLPLATVHLQPMVMLSLHDTPVMRAHTEWFTRTPRWLKRAFFALPNPLDVCAGKSVRAVCARAGVAPPRGLVDWIHSPDAVLGLFPDWFGPPQPDWPPHCRLAGFPLYDLGDRQELAPEVERFLSAGPAPVVFTPGSAMLHGQEFFATALAACQRLGLRAIFATNHPEQLPRDLPPTVLPVAYAPFSRLLPRAAALVHHGGIGTLSQALAAGIPQLVMPMAHDQPDNAHRLVRLGVARRLYPKKFTPQNVAAALRELRADPAVHAVCAALAARVRAARPAEIVLHMLESLTRTSS